MPDRSRLPGSHQRKHLSPQPQFRPWTRIAGSCAAEGTRPAAEVTDHDKENRMPAIELEKYLRSSTKGYHTCIEACVECLVACEMCSDACLDESNVKMMVECIRLDRDCADACVAAIRAMARGGPMARELCEMCADACDRCAEECEKHDDDHCRICAEACRRCARECRQMARVAA